MEWLERLRTFKSQTNETYKSISDKTGIPQTTIDKFFCGRTKDPKLKMIREIVHCLNHTLDDLVEDKNDHNPQLNQEENKLISDFRALSEQGKDYILQTMTMAKNTYQDNKNINTKTISDDITEELKQVSINSTKIK